MEFEFNYEKRITAILIFSMLILGACNQGEKTSTEKRIETGQCDLSDQVDSSGAGFNDFTISQVELSTKDNQGTYWKKSTTDEYRFVFHSGTKGEGQVLVVYKNEQVFEKYMNLIEQSCRSIPVDKIKCELDYPKERVSTKWIVLRKNNKPKGGNILDEIIANHGTKKTLIDFDVYYSKCYCSVWYYIDERTKIFGRLKLPPRAGQTCPE